VPAAFVVSIITIGHRGHRLYNATSLNYSMVLTPNVVYIITMLYLVYFNLWPLPGLYIWQVSTGRDNDLSENNGAYLHLPPDLACSS
jgi:hypothetical protein